MAKYGDASTTSSLQGRGGDTNLDPKLLYGRVTEGDLIAWRGFRIQTMQDWKARLQGVDRLYRGDWNEMYSDQTTLTEYPMVQNLVQVGMNDIAKLVSEASGVTRCWPDKDTNDGELDALTRQLIGEGYWYFGNGESLIPNLAMDIAGGGMGALGVWVDDDSQYPCYTRIDPRFAYPDVRNGKIQDLLCVEEMNLRLAAREFPKLNLNDDPQIISDKVEILTYYGKHECVQAVMWKTMGATPVEKPSVKIRAEIVSRWNPEGILPVAFAKLDSFDGSIRGLFDQMGGTLQTKNRVVRQLMDYTDEIVYAPRMSKGLLNPDEPFSPDTHYRIDPNFPDGMMGRVPPAATAPEVLGLMEYLDKEQRGSMSFPASRQGEVSQAIASASFVASTQGQLTSEVRNVQRLIAQIRQQLNAICYAYDEKFLDTEKPLMRPIGRKKTYTPSKDIHGNYSSRVLYGAGAGINPLNADVRILQLLGAKVIGLEQAREQIDFIDDPDRAGQLVDLEQTEMAVMQKFLTEADLPTMLRVLHMQVTDGLDLTEALAQLAKEAQAQPPAQPGLEPGAQPGQPGPVPAGQSAAQGAQALQAGGIPEGAGPAPTFAPPLPAEAIQVSAPNPGRTVQLRNT